MSAVYGADGYMRGDTIEMNEFNQGGGDADVYTDEYGSEEMAERAAAMKSLRSFVDGIDEQSPPVHIIVRMMNKSAFDIRN